MGEAVVIFVILPARFTLKVYHLLSPWEGPGALTIGRSDSSCFWEWEMRWQSSGVLWGPGRRGVPGEVLHRSPPPISALSWLAFCLPVPQCNGNLLQSSFPSLWHLPPGVGQALNSRPCLQCFGISIKLKQISIFMSFQEPPVVLFSF